MTIANPTLVDVKLTFAYLAEQPIIHTDETIGNISKLKKMRVLYNGKPVSVPALSGNSFRGQLRDILADELCAPLSNHGEKRLQFESPETYAILYSGGALSETSTSGNLIHAFAGHLPSIRLMGAAFGNVMLPSKLAVTHIIPCAKETQDILQGMHGAVENGLVPPRETWPNALDLLFNDGPLTRKDDSRDLTRQRFASPLPKSQGYTGDAVEAQDSQHTDAEPTSQNDAGTAAGSRNPQQMIYYVECIPAGTWLLQQLYSKFPLDRLELGCLFGALDAFLRQPTLGGRSSAGYGQVRVALRGTVDTAPVQWPKKWPKIINDAVKGYEKYLGDKHKDILKALTVQTEETAQ